MGGWLHAATLSLVHESIPGTVCRPITAMLETILWLDQRLSLHRLAVSHRVQAGQQRSGQGWRPQPVSATMSASKCHDKCQRRKQRHVQPMFSTSTQDKLRRIRTGIGLRRGRTLCCVPLAPELCVHTC